MAKKTVIPLSLFRNIFTFEALKKCLLFFFSQNNLFNKYNSKFFPMKKITLFFLTLLFAFCLSAQDSRLWGTYYGGTGGDFGYAVATDNNGNVYVAGMTNDNDASVFFSGGFQNTYGGGTNDAFLVKFDSNGNRLWSTYYGGSGIDQGYAVTTNSIGDVYLAGFTTSTNGISTLGSHQPAFGGGTYDAFIVKFDAAGTRLWGTYYGGTNSSYGQTLATDPMGNLYFGGYTSDTQVGSIATPGAHQTVNGGGNYDAFLVMFDSGGNRIWGTYYGGAGSEGVFPPATVPSTNVSLALDKAGAIYLGGFTSSATAIATPGAYQTFNAGGNFDGFAAKFTPIGTRVWGTYFGDNQQDEIRSIAVHDNKLYLSGRTASSNNIATTGSYQDFYGGGSYDAFLARFDTSGTEIWSTYYGDGGQEWGLAVTTDAMGNIYQAGRSSSTINIASADGFQTVFGGSVDNYVVKFDTSGFRYCATYLGGAGTDISYGAVISNGKIFMTGQTTSAGGIAAGGYDNTYGGNTDAFLAKFSSCIYTTMSQTNPLCGNVCDGTATADPSFGGTLLPYSYMWTPGGQTTQTATGLCAGSYTVVVSDANGNTTADFVTITAPPALTTTVTTISSTCGNSDGSAAVAVSGGNPPYAYAWSTAPVQTTAIATGIPAGSYTVLITDADGCTATDIATVVNSDGPVASILSQTNVSCNGGSNGSATGDATGPNAPFTYSWNTTPVQTTATATGLSAGVYIVTATNANGCTDTASAVITQPTAITATISTTGEACGSSNGTATASASGGTPGYNYAWSTAPVQSTATATGLIAGTYTVLVTDANSCTNTFTATVSSISGPTAGIASQVNVSCNGGSNGSATASVSGGTPAFTYSWSTAPIQTTITATGLAMGTYTVLVTDANACTGTATVSITEPAALTTTVSATAASCGSANGSTTVTVSGGTPSYAYNWSTTPVQTTSTATGLSPGTYSVLVTDANGCTTAATATVGITGGSTASISAQTNVSCNGGNNGSATVSVSSATPPYTYSWTTAPVQTTTTATGLSAGTYSVTVTDTYGCVGSTTVSITEPTAFTGSVSTTSAACGNNNGSATLTVSGGTAPYTYSWTTTPIQTTATATGLAAGNYTVTGTDANGCQQMHSAVISTSAGPSVSISSQTNVSCNGGNNGAATASVSGGTPAYTYSWSTAPAQTTVTATGLVAGNYTVTVSDANSCTGTATVTITQPAVITTSVSVTGSTCGNSDGSATASASGGTPGYAYGWSTTPVQLTATATGLPAGTYTVTVFDANGCSTTNTATITNTNGPIVSIASQTNVNCNGGSNGSANASVTGGSTPYTYSWSTTPMQTTVSATGLSAGTYTVLVTDAGGCTGMATAAITEPTAITTTISSTPGTCGNNNGTATVAASGGTPGYIYGWSTVPVQMTPTATGLAAGTYTVTVSDANSCTTTATVTVAPSTVPISSIASQTNVSCNGGSDGAATASVTGGTPAFTYSWSTVPVQTSLTATGLAMGTYTFVVTDANGCTGTATVSITEPTAITSTITTTNSSCSMSTGSATVIASGGTPSYTYAWSTAPVQTTSTATGLVAGSYTVTITDANGCIANAFANVINSNGPVASVASQTNVTCNGDSDGNAVSSVTGGQVPYTYLWNTAPPQSTANATGLSAGTYSFTVTDANGCTSVTSATITEPAAISVSVTTTPASCGSSNGSATATVSGGTPGYTYSWFPGGETTSAITNQPAGSYLLTVTDANGCNTIISVTINSSGTPTVTILSQSNVSCNGGNDGSATSNVTGGASPYTYSWSTTPVQTTATATGLMAGTYSIIVTDATGCSGTTAVTITQPIGMSVSISNTSATCGNNDGSATATVSNGASPYIYNWSSGQTTATANSLMAGSYTVTITDANGCTTTSSTIIINSNGPTASILSQTNASCFGASDGSATATASGATPPYTYVWNSSPSQTAATATGLSAGMYTVTVTDAAGCASISIVAITEPSAVSVWAYALSNATCPTCCDGTASDSASGGTAPYIYSWSTTPVQTTVSATGLCGGMTYTLCLTDANGCSSCDTVTIPVNNTTGVFSANQDVIITIFPNPANDYLFVEGTVSSSEKVEVTIVNPFGQMMQKNNFTVNGKFSEKLNTENLPAGIYFMEINSSDINRKLKFVIK